MARTDTSIRPPAIAGTFYPGEQAALRGMIDQCMKAVRVKQAPPKALVAPHAGYIYSGPIAATAYASLAPIADKVTRVVLLGPSHRVAFEGMALSSASAFRTPLGDVPIDRAACERIAKLPGVQTLDTAHAEEHSLEVHLPFLQTVLSDFSLVPIVVGRAPEAQVDAVLQALWGGEETLVVVSSDLSHYHDYAAAQRMDGAASLAIETLDAAKLGDDQACGRYPVKGLLARARALDLRATTLDLRNSGDTAGDKARVVGYGAYAFEYAASARLPDDQRRYLGEIARASIRQGAGRPTSNIGGPRDPQAQPKLHLRNVPRPLMSARASFVTVTLDGNLRGCVGSVAPHQALVVDVAASAYKAAFSDPRFPPVTQGEAARIEIGVSILSHTRPIAFSSEAELIDALNPDIDGVVLAHGEQRGLFLPQVWESLRTPDAFLRRLKEKAGLKPDFWSQNMKAYRFTTESFCAV
ncbi:MAG TPA: AmmeMemoRadiSam system protein B [Alphaproteobacteria bacterium]|nr:AmmeMemoRadiSam system protein B [Alphaproteobacteria bacterium]